MVYTTSRKCYRTKLETNITCIRYGVVSYVSCVYCFTSTYLTGVYAYPGGLRCDKRVILASFCIGVLHTGIWKDAKTYCDEQRIK